MELILEDLGEHPIFEGVRVKIDIRGLLLNLDTEVLELPYTLRYFKDGVEVTDRFTKLVPNWEIRNSHLIMVRDENFQPIPNPDYEETKDKDGNVTNAEEKFIRQPAFDYMANIFKLLMGDMLKGYIHEEHQDGKFLQ